MQGKFQVQGHVLAEAGMQHCQMYIGILLNGFLFTYLFICIFLGLRSAATLSFSLQL